MEAIYSDLTTRAMRILEHGHGSNLRRVIVAVAGAPGSGKSTIAAAVIQALNDKAPQPIAVCVPMDGLNLPRAILDELPNRGEAYARRGAPWTFDAEKVIDFVHHLAKSRTENMGTMLAPSFDHALKDPVEDGISIAEGISLVLLEGN